MGGEDVVRVPNRLSSLHDASEYVFDDNGGEITGCLNAHWFANLTKARAVLETWRIDYNKSRPHSALKDLTPDEYAIKIKQLGLA